MDTENKQAKMDTFAADLFDIWKQTMTIQYPELLPKPEPSEAKEE